MRYFTDGIDKYLANWLQVDTWYTHLDIEDRFYAFVMAIDRNSRPIKDSTRSVNRNPRTYDKAAFIEKVLLAIQRNWPDFDQEHARQLIEKLATKAMMILDALWYDRHTNHRHIREIDLTDFK
ncbi:MAG: hypothetical protein JXM70_25320 [Pirellulales bacterium]|nr:hypothetical protein [Pirellulales bacterium]